MNGPRFGPVLWVAGTFIHSDCPLPLESIHESLYELVRLQNDGEHSCSWATREESIEFEQGVLSRLLRHFRYFGNEWPTVEEACDLCK